MHYSLTCFDSQMWLHWVKPAACWGLQNFLGSEQLNGAHDYKLLIRWKWEQGPGALQFKGENETSHSKKGLGDPDVRHWFLHPFCPIMFLSCSLLLGETAWV